MKKYIFIIAFVIGNYAQASVNWLNSFEQAQIMALSTNKLILIDFYARWCGPCKRMDMDVWSDAEVGKLTQYFVPLKIDIDIQRSIANRYNVNAIPTTIIVDGNGKIVYENTCYMDADDVLTLLKKYALRTEYVQYQALNYYKKKSYFTALRLGRRYLDFSLYLKNEPRNNFLHLGEKYLREGKKMLRKDSPNYPMLRQRIALLELVADLHSKRYKHVYKKLNDFEASEIHKHNKKLYYYLNYCSQKGLQKETAKKWYAKLANHKRLLKKANLLLAEG